MAITVMLPPCRFFEQYPDLHHYLNTGEYIMPDPPTLTKSLQPAMRLIAGEENALEGNGYLEIAAEGTPPLLYLWHRNDEIIDDSDVLKPHITVTLPGRYHCTVSNMCGVRPSAACTVDIVSAPEIDEHPQGGIRHGKCYGFPARAASSSHGAI